jgi:ATP-dependent DNA helicase RecG
VRLEHGELAKDEFRALLEAYRKGRVDNASMRRIAGLDTLQASQLLRRLRDRGLLQLHAAGSASYYTLGDSLGGEERRIVGDQLLFENTTSVQTDTSTPEQKTSTPEQKTSASEQKTSARSALLIEIPTQLRERVQSVRRRAPLNEMQTLVRDLCAWRPLRPSELALLLNRGTSRVISAYLKPLVDAGELERTHPETPHHPDQAYTATPSTPEP